MAKWPGVYDSRTNHPDRLRSWLALVKRLIPARPLFPCTSGLSPHPEEVRHGRIFTAHHSKSAHPAVSYGFVRASIEQGLRSTLELRPDIENWYLHHFSLLGNSTAGTKERSFMPPIESVDLGSSRCRTLSEDGKTLSRRQETTTTTENQRRARRMNYHQGDIRS
jgi:hypothetical protein